ncbi:Hypothetical predicted protein, partial [Paramuricea clavata]
MEKLFRNRDLNVSVRTVKSGEEVLFYGKDVAESLGYSNTKKAIQTHVWRINKLTLGELRMGPKLGPLIDGHPDSVFLREP